MACPGCETAQGQNEADKKLVGDPRGSLLDGSFPRE